MVLPVAPFSQCGNTPWYESAFHKNSQLLKKELDRLGGMSGYAFDAAFLKDMEEIHAKDGAAFAGEATDGTNPRLRAFAAETHRIVVRHIGALTPVGAETN